MAYDYDKPFTFDRVVRLVISLVLIAFGIYMVYILSGALLPFLIAWLIAYLLNPFVRFFQNKLRIRNRLAAVTLTFAIVIGVITGIVIIIAPMIENELFQINQLIATYELQTLNMEGVPVSIADFVKENIDLKALSEALSKQQAQDTLKYLVPAIQNVVSSSISFLLGFTVIFIILLYLIFILMDYDKINKLWMTMVPPRHRPFVERVTLDVERSMNTYFRHQALICLIVGTLFAICFQIIGLPLAILMGVLIGILHMIPYMHTLSVLPAALLAWIKVSQTDQSFWPYMGIIILIYIGIQCIIDLVLVPRIMGKAMGLNPAIILLSLSIWGSLMGIVGMIIAIPLTTLLLSYYQQFINEPSIDNIEKVIEKEDEKWRES